MTALWTVTKNLDCVLTDTEHCMLMSILRLTLMSAVVIEIAWIMFAPLQTTGKA